MAKRKSLKERATQHKNRPKGVWRGGKKKGKPSFEGGQYFGGREKGRKNLKKLDDGSLLNQHGVTFTQEEKKLLENLANRSNRIRTKMLEKEAALPRFAAGKDTGDTVASLQAMGKESDFIITRKSKSLQRFTSKEQFYNYIDNLKNVVRPDYVDERTRLYKRNHMQALRDVFGDEAKDIIMKIRMMKPGEYREMLQKDEMLEISYIYDSSERAAKLNNIRAALGMKLKEVW